MTTLELAAPPAEPWLQDDLDALEDALGPMDITDVTVVRPPTSVGGTPFSCSTCTFSVTICC